MSTNGGKLGPRDEENSAFVASCPTKELAPSVGLVLENWLHRELSPCHPCNRLPATLWHAFISAMSKWGVEGL